MTMLIRNNKQGFTLIELMIAISIIAILATIGFSTYTQSQIRGRDLKRKQDLRSIASALALYYQKNGRYPCTGDTSTGYQTSSTGGNWITDTNLSGAFPTSNCSGTTDFNNNYISSLPLDPVRNNNSAALITGGGYGYRSVNWGGNCPNIPGQYYVLYTLLENSNDSERHEVKQYKLYCSDTVFDNLNGTAYPNNSFFVTPY